MPVKAILFDLDGVIVDTLHFHFLAWNEMFHRWGGEVKELTVLIHEGRSSREILPLLIEEAGIEIPEDERHDFIETKRAYYRSIVDVQFYPEAKETLKQLHKEGYTLALVTACARKNMNHALSEDELKLFDVIITGDDIPRAKPNPDPYDIARKKLGLKKDECLVIENAPLGIESGKNAGIKVAAIATTLPKEYLKGADYYLNTLSDIFQYLK
ncbi:MAG TPA: HAD family phosphatase [Candidatus Cloacimonetes bacterium]|nr:HAD family phosphatase [Candidatus Cloacimonadota bacterium]HHE40441.1 HAD family phosphatase [Candidatus Cloacimonadota bacterium]